MPEDATAEAGDKRRNGKRTSTIFVKPIAKDVFAAVTAIHQVIDGSGKLDP